MSKLRSSVVVSLAFLAAFIGRIAQGAVNASAVAPDIVKNSALAWYDAADASTITADANGVVSAWADKSAHGRTATVASGFTGPISTALYGCPCLDFGTEGSYQDLVYVRMTTIRTAFLVGRFQKSMKVFLLGDSANGSQSNCYFHRGDNGEYLSSKWAQDTSARIWNGFKEVKPYADVLPAEPVQFLVCKMSTPCASSAFSQDRNQGGRNGGRQLYEVILFEKELDDAERTEVMEYLQTKWRFDPAPTPYRASFPSTLVARWDFNNYNPANPTSTDILVDTVSGARAVPAENKDNKNNKNENNSTPITDGTIGAMYVVSPDYAGSDGEVTTCANTLETGNYAIAIPQWKHLRLPIPDELKTSSRWTMRVRLWSPLASDYKYRCILNKKENSDDGDLFIRSSDNKVGISSYSGNALTSGTWHTIVINAGPNRSDVFLDGAEVKYWNDSHFSAFMKENSDYFVFCGDDNGEDNTLYVDYVELYADGGAAEAKLPVQSKSGMVGEWRFSGTGDERLKATVGYDLEKSVRTGAVNIDLSGTDGVLPGDGYARAGQNNGFKCYHNLPKNSSYTVVMDVRVPTVKSGEWYALFQPLAQNNGDCRYYLCPDGDGLNLWVASGKYTGRVAAAGEWIRVVITYENGGNKVIYVNGAKIDTRSDNNMVITDDHFYFLVENSGEDHTTDLSYAAIYDRVLTDNEIAELHSRCTAHDADGNLILKTAPAGLWLNEGGSWSAVKGQPLAEEANGLVWTRSEAAPAEATYIMDVTLPETQTDGGALVMNANNVASGVYGTSSSYNGSFTTTKTPAGLTGNSVYSEWGYWTYNTLERGVPHRVAVTWSKTGTVLYYVDGRIWCQLFPAYANTAATPTQTMRFLTDSGATATMITAYDRALAPEEIALIGTAGQPTDPKAAPAVTLASDKTEAKASVDTFTFTVAGSSTDDERVSYQIDYGDGTVETTSDWEPMAQKTYTHVYGEVGTFIVKARVYTYSGAMTDATVTVTTVAATKPALEVVKVAPWQQNVYTNRFTIMFESSSEQLGIELQCGTDYAQRVPMTGVQDNGGYWLYKATATVEGHEGEEIPYRLGFFGLALTDDAEGVSSGTVRLWADGEADFSCAIWGDNQQGSRAGDWDSDKYAYVSALFEHMIARDVDFGLSTGDMASGGNYASEIAPLILERTNGIFGRHKPYYVAFGNHDTSYSVNRTYFETPAANDPYYAQSYVETSGRGNSYLYRNNVLFILVDQALQGDGGTKTWLANLLATDRAQAAKFRILLQHFPFWLECWSGNNNTALLETAKTGGVDIIFSGHMHGYERYMKDGIVQLTNGGAGYLDHVESVTTFYGDDIFVGGHKNLPYLWARQKSTSETDVLGGAEPVRMGCIQSYGELSVKGGELTYTAHGFDANGDYIGVFDTFAITSKTTTVDAPAPVAPSASCANPESFAEFTSKPVTNAKWAEYKEAVGEAFAYPDGAGSRPVVNVSRTEIEKFLVWLNGETGDYRLPTVDELAVAFGGELRREVSEWTSSVDPNTGWCRILGSPAKAQDGTWTREDDKPSIATPGCHADYLGFRLATGPAPTPAVDPWAAPFAALAEIAEPARAYKWENGQLVDISDAFYAASGAQTYDVPVILTDSGEITRENPDALVFNAGFTAPNSTSFFTAGSLTVKGEVKAGIISNQWQWRMGSTDGTLTVEDVVYRGVGVVFAAGDRTVRVKGDCDFSGAMLTFDHGSYHPTNVVTAVEGEAATIRLASAQNTGDFPFRVGENVTMKLTGEYRVLKSTKLHVEGVLDAESFNIQGNVDPCIYGAGTLKIGYYGSYQNSWPYFGISNLVVTTRRFWRANYASTKSYNGILIDGDEVHISSTCDWEIPPKDQFGYNTYFLSNNRSSRAKVVFEGDHDVLFAPTYTAGKLSSTNFNDPWDLEKTGSGTLTLATSFSNPLAASGGTVRLEDGIALSSDANRLAAGATLQLAEQSGLVRVTSEGGTLALATGVARATLANGSRIAGPVVLAEGVEKLALDYLLPADNPMGAYEVLVDSGLKAEQIDLTCAVPEGYQLITTVSEDGDATIFVTESGKTVSEWTGAGDTSNPSDPANWQGGKVPDENAYVYLQSSTTFTLPEGATLSIAGFILSNTTLELSDNCDWRGIGEAWTAESFAGVTIDLKGRVLRLAAPNGTYSGSLTITDTTSENPGDLRMEVAEDETFTNSGLTLAGNVRLVKDGAGTFVANKDYQTYRRGNEVCEGTLRASALPERHSMGGNGINSSSAATNVVHAGATFDINDQINWGYNTFILDGGTLVRASKKVNCPITLTADSTISSRDSSDSEAVLQENPLDLGGHVLTFKIKGGCPFYMRSTAILNGTILYDQGGWLAFDRALDAPTLDLDIRESVRVTSPITVRNYICNHPSDYNDGDELISVTGVFALAPNAKDYFHGVLMKDGSVMDLSGRTSALNVVSGFSKGAKTCTFEPGATIGVKLGAKKRGKIVAWETRPDASVKFVVPKGSGCWLDVRNDGLYACQGLLMVFR